MPYMMNPGMRGGVPPQYAARTPGGPPGGVSNGMQQIPPSGPMMRAQVLNTVSCAATL